MDAEKVEDGIAFVAQRRKAAPASGFAARLFSGVRDFFRALGNALKGNGFKTPESIFRDIREGKFGEWLSAQEVREILAIVGLSNCQPLCGSACAT